jgi:flagellar motor switch protein FliN
MTRDDLRARIAAAFPRVVGSTLNASASKRLAAPRNDDGFLVRVTGTGDARGELRMIIGRRGATTFVKSASGNGLEPPDQLVIEKLKELCNRVIGSVDPDVGNAMLAVVAVTPIATLPVDEDSLVFEVMSAGVEHGLYVVLTGDLEVTCGAQGASSESKTLDVIMDIDLPLVVRFGRTELPLKTLTSLGPGSVIDLGRAPDDPVEVLISNRVVARGEVVIVAGSYGVRVRDVVSPAERARSLEAELS